MLSQVSAAPGLTPECATAREVPQPGVGGCSTRFRLLHPGVVHDEYSLLVLSKSVINGRNYLRVSHRQVQCFVATCLIIVIRKRLEVPGVHFWKPNSEGITANLDGFVHCIKR